MLATDAFFIDDQPSAPPPPSPPSLLTSSPPPRLGDAGFEASALATDALRYWNEPSRPACSICHDAHLTRDCHHLRCLTCGAIDQHSARLCPVSLVCFACGSRGHLSKHCPSASTASAPRPCYHCRSNLHLSPNCPSIWRCYVEESNDRPLPVMPACYSCAGNGDHFGDECPFNRNDPPSERSAFSSRAYRRPDRSPPRSPPRHHPQSDRDRRMFSRHYRSPRESAPSPDSFPRGYSPNWSPRDRPTHDPKPKRKQVQYEDEGDDSDDWFSNRRRDHAKRNGASLDSRRSKDQGSARLGGSYKGGYLRS